MNASYRASLCALLLSVSLLLCGCDAFFAMPPADETVNENPEILPETDCPETSESFTKIDNTALYKATAEAYLADIQKVDYDGAAFFITSPRTDVIDPLDTADCYSLAKHERNAAVEKGWNVCLTAAAVEEASLAAAVRESILAEEYFADLILIPQYLLGTLYRDGSLMNLRSLPFLDLTKPYFDKASADAATAENGVFGIAGPASFEATTLTAVFFNRDLFSENDIPLPYDSVTAGTWTWDAFFTYSETVSDINEKRDTSYSAYTTQYAADTLPSSMFFSAGSRFVKQENGTPVLAYTEADASAASYIRTLFQDTGMYKDTATGLSRFHEGNALFLLDRLYLTSWMVGSAQSWGILPLPKATPEQADYVSLADECVLFFGTPKNNVHAERTAHILSALNAASYGVLSDAYVTSSLYHVLRDNDSANMLEILIDSRTYDFSFTFGHTDLTLSNAAYGGMKQIAGGTQFTTLVKQIQRVNAQLSKNYSG